MTSKPLDPFLRSNWRKLVAPQPGLTKRGVLGARDNFVLQRLAQVAEVIAITRHAHDKITVLLGMFLGSPQRGGIHHVELNVVPI